MTLQQLYAKNDAEYFPSAYEGVDENRPSTLFFADFMVAEAFGRKAVFDTMANCGMGGSDPNQWRKGLESRYTNFEITELCAVLNHLIWRAYDAGNEKLQDYYQRRYYFICSLVDNWSKEDQLHFFYVMD